MKVHKSFVAWWLGAGLCLEVAVAYAYFAGDWGCIDALLRTEKIAGSSVFCLASLAIWRERWRSWARSNIQFVPS